MAGNTIWTCSTSWRSMISTWARWREQGAEHLQLQVRAGHARDGEPTRDYDFIEGIVAHEYFHNWTGNRINLPRLVPAVPEGGG